MVVAEKWGKCNSFVRALATLTKVDDRREQLSYYTFLRDHLKMIPEDGAGVPSNIENSVQKLLAMRSGVTAPSFSREQKDGKPLNTVGYDRASGKVPEVYRLHSVLSRY
jgi:hypothetical protein